MSTPFLSYAQNREDVVLWRALHKVPAGKYVEVGANDPKRDSVSRAFYERGWRGVTFEPMPSYAARHRAERPGDQLVEAAVTQTSNGTITLHQFEGTGLSTTIDTVSNSHRLAGLTPTELTVRTVRLDETLDSTGWAHDDIRFMSIDVEGAEAEVLRSIDLKIWRPWILVIEAAAPEATGNANGPLRSDTSQVGWEDLVLSAGYQACLFDGVSNFYVADEYAEKLGPDLRYPACALDNFESYLLHDANAELVKLQEELRLMTIDAVEWRTIALTHWANATSGAAGSTWAGQDVQTLRSELEAIQNTVSWRVTAPLRSVRKGASRKRAS